LRFRLVPTDEGFFPLFNEAAQNLADGARQLRDLLDEFEDVRGKHAKIDDCERRGDQLTRAILRRLDESFVTPFDREDIHALTEKLDDVVDDIQAVSELLLLHDVEEPLPEAAEANVALIAKLPKLKGLDGELEAIDKLESEADRLYRHAVARLFSGDFNAFDVLRWKDIVEAIEDAVNKLEGVSDIVEGIALKHS
jgi:uncharacterized protein